SNISGIGSLLNLALQDPEHYHSQVNEVLSTLVRQRATEDQVRDSGECNDAGAEKLKYERSEALPEVQAAMNALGDPRFAMLRHRFSAGGCEVRTLRLDHRYLDELDLRDKDLSCADLSQSHFRRASFYHAILRGVNFGGARIADFDLPDFPQNDADA